MRTQKSKNIIKTLASKNEIGTLLPLIIICIVVTIINPAFIAIDNVMDILRTASYS